MRGFLFKRGKQRPAGLMVGLLVAWLSCESASANHLEGNLLVAASTLGGPSIQVSESNYDFGEVDEGAKVSHDFVVENRGAGELAITKVSPD